MTDTGSADTPPAISLRELRDQLGQRVDAAFYANAVTIITKNGAPRAALVPIYFEGPIDFKGQPPKKRTYGTRITCPGGCGKTVGVLPINGRISVHDGKGGMCPASRTLAPDAGPDES